MIRAHIKPWTGMAWEAQVTCQALSPVLRPLEGFWKWLASFLPFRPFLDCDLIDLL